MTSATLSPALMSLRSLLVDGGVIVLSGAGLSTESGIPDYRGPGGSLRHHTPMTYQEFIGSVDARRRYWARSHLGWRRMASASPNDGHAAVAALQARGVIGTVITQNVDGLHQAAGASDVIELHGGLDRVVCLGCGAVSSRATLEARLRAANPSFGTLTGDGGRINPDGDAEISTAALDSFVTVPCVSCGDDLLKPDVVFFGENVPKPRVAVCYSAVEAARSLLVLGSSLTVMSGLLFVRRAAALGIPVALVNQGPTRGDELIPLRVSAPLGPTLRSLVASLD